MKPIFLIGFMGTGKTTLGRALAGAPPYRLEYVDLDDCIERQEGMSVREIFADRGEAAFRSMETRVLRSFAGRENVVVGCGGGTPCHSGNMEWMNENGLTVKLEASADTLLRRLLEAQEQRPLLAGMSPTEMERFIEARQREREVFYGKASVRFRSDRLETPGEIAGTCSAFIEMLGERMHAEAAPDSEKY